MDNPCTLLGLGRRMVAYVYQALDYPIKRIDIIVEQYNVVSFGDNRFRIDKRKLLDTHFNLCFNRQKTSQNPLHLPNIPPKGDFYKQIP